jgi:DNA replication protein DnaC
MIAAAPPALAGDLVDALCRLKLATVREQAAEVLQTARAQRWEGEEVLRALLQAEIAARDVANRRVRLKQAGFRVLKNLDTFNVTESSIPRPTYDYIASLEWVRARENLLLVGPSGTGKSHVLIGCGVRAVERGMKVRYLVTPDLIETLYRGLADNTVSKVISQLLRHDLILVDELGSLLWMTPVPSCYSSQPGTGQSLAL